MSWIGSIFGSGIGEASKGVSKLINTVADTFTETDREKQEYIRLDLKRREIDQKTDLAQIQLNTAEAQHKSVFVAGWRPFIGWVCGVALAYQFLVYPLIGPFLEQYLEVGLYKLEWGHLQTVVLGMLGMGAMRTFEKQKGIDSKTVRGG